MFIPLKYVNIQNWKANVTTNGLQ